MATESASAAATDPIDGMVRGNAGRMQAYRLREVAFRLALDVAGVTVENPSDELRARARDFAAVVRAWTDTNDQSRIANGRPLPGSLRPERKPKQPRKSIVGPLRPARVKLEDSPRGSAEAPVQVQPVPDSIPTAPSPAISDASSVKVQPAQSDTASPAKPVE